MELQTLVLAVEVLVMEQTMVQVLAALAVTAVAVLLLFGTQFNVKYSGGIANGNS
jgi:hypothetical protein